MALLRSVSEGQGWLVEQLFSTQLEACRRAAIFVRTMRCRLGRGRALETFLNSLALRLFTQEMKSLDVCVRQGSPEKQNNSRDRDINREGGRAGGR